MSKSLIYHTLINTNGEVFVNTGDKVVVSTQMEGLSRSGLLLHCDGSTLENLFPHTPTISPKQSQTLDISFGLAEVGKVEAQCEVISVRRLAKDTFALELKFSDVNDRAVYIVDSYVERKLKQQVATQNTIEAANHHFERKVA